MLKSTFMFLASRSASLALCHVQAAFLAARWLLRLGSSLPSLAMRYLLILLICSFEQCNTVAVHNNMLLSQHAQYGQPFARMLKTDGQTDEHMVRRTSAKRTNVGLAPKYSCTQWLWPDDYKTEAKLQVTYRKSRNFDRKNYDFIIFLSLISKRK